MDIKKCSQKLSIRNSDMVEFHKAQTILRQIGGSQWNLCSSCLHQCLDHRFRKASWEPVFHGEKMMNGKLCDCPVQLFQEHFSSYSSRVHFFRGQSQHHEPQPRYNWALRPRRQPHRWASPALPMSPDPQLGSGHCLLKSTPWIS